MDKVERFHPKWCRYCELPAKYEAEARNGMAVDVCSVKKHFKFLTNSKPRLIVRLK